MYSASFKTLKDDKISIQINTSSSALDELVLDGNEPVTIEYVQDDVFSPLKKSLCTVSFIADGATLNLFTGKLTDVSISVKRNDSLIWYGYLQPNTYSQPLDSKNNRVSLTFVCPITAMESVKFKKFGDNFYATFSQYIAQALSVVEASLTITGIPSDLASVGCMQRNYIDETQDEDEGAMSWSEVLESIMRYMNMTAYCYGNKLYIYDPLAERTPKSISDIGIAGNDGNISLGNVYNKVTVVANNNPLEGSIPDILNEDDFVAQTSSPQYQKTGYFADQLQYGERSCVHYDDDDTSKYYLLNAAFRSKKWGLSSSYTTKTHSVSWMGENIAINSSPTTGTSTNVPWSSMLSYEQVPGSWAGTTKPYYSLQTTHILGSFIQRYASVTKKGVTSNVKWEKCLTLAGLNSSATLSDRPHFVGQDGYIVLSCSFKMSYWAYPQSCVMGFEINADDSLPLKLACQLKIGNKYYNGKNADGSGKWSTSPYTFYIRYTSDSGKYTTNTEVSIDNEVSWNFGLNTDKEGMLIPLPKNEVLSGVVSFNIKNVETNEKHIPVSYYHITELSLQYASQNTIKDIFNLDEYDADIKYTGNLDADNVDEMSDVTFTTNTYTKKATSYSYAIKLSSGIYSYYVPSTIPEQACVTRLVEYFGTSRMSYQITLDDALGHYIGPADNISASFLSREFTVGSVTYNLADNSAEVTLLEV